jgi:hypothetical protein
MSTLVVGSIALDTVETPYGNAADSLGGSALYFSAAASFFGPVDIVGVVGKDFDFSKIDFLKERKVYPLKCFPKFSAGHSGSVSQGRVHFPGEHRPGIAIGCTGANRQTPVIGFRYYEFLDQRRPGAVNAPDQKGRCAHSE